MRLLIGYESRGLLNLNHCVIFERTRADALVDLDFEIEEKKIGCIEYFNI